MLLVHILKQAFEHKKKTLFFLIMSYVSWDNHVMKYYLF